jgi:Protein of unknown function (DUF664)
MPERPIERHQPDQAVGERETLTQRLDFLRASVVTKADGLTDDQAFAHPVPASALTIGGVVKHLTCTERWWFSIDFAGLDVAWPWPDDDPHGCFPISTDDTIDGIIDEYIDEIERSQEAIAASSLDAMATGNDMYFNLRYALTHMIEETARHCGHLDLLRESVDGTTGE